ncbi:hypothetical protein TNCV_2813641 [Trichonephila clavipes]|nr:hypothetical protein TNCV_2813641 [Trichonephila clavipes]
MDIWGGRDCRVVRVAVVEIKVRVKVPLTTRRVEKLTHIKSHEAQSLYAGVMWKFGERGFHLSSFIFVTWS